MRNPSRGGGASPSKSVLRRHSPQAPSPVTLFLDNTYLFRASSLFSISLRCLLSAMLPVTRVVARHALDTGSQSVMTVSLVRSPMLFGRIKPCLIYRRRLGGPRWRNPSKPVPVTRHQSTSHPQLSSRARLYASDFDDVQPTGLLHQIGRSQAFCRVQR